MMGAHTPGPWTLEPVTEFRPTRVEPRVADVLGLGAEAEANARLITAAPELLAALKRSVEVLDAEGVVYGNCDDEPLDVLAAARAAIVRAEGR